jgi:Flp pilus assembly protein TadG
MSTNSRANSRQEGAVVIVMSLFLVVVVGVLALVVDLGHLYSTKTGLQNAADAAALAGARELNGSAAGVQAAVTKAIDIARQNRYDFYQPVGTAAADGGLQIQVGMSPDDMIDADLVDTDSEAANKTFVRVSTGSRSVETWFAGIWGIRSTSTYAVAVAGQAGSELALLAVCALPGDSANPRDNELGYERGLAYKVSDVNPLAPGTMYWLDAGAGPDDCVGSTTGSLPFACAGRIPFTVPVGQNVYTNTGVSDPLLEAMDSRFDVFSSKNKCDPIHAPPDRNIKEYRYAAAGAGNPTQWMQPDPTRQSLLFTSQAGGLLPKPLASRSFADYGVLWASSRPPAAAVSDWATLYGGAATSYPNPSPYAQTSGAYFAAPRPANQPGKAGRRMLNVAMLDCSASTGGSCRPLRVMGYGRFFMQRKANVPSDKEFYLEFDGLLPGSFPAGEVKLYR